MLRQDVAQAGIALRDTPSGEAAAQLLEEPRAAGLDTQSETGATDDAG